MNLISAAWNKIGLQLKLQLLIQGLLIVILLASQHFISAHFERATLSAAEERAKAVADGAINGLNTLMLVKAGGNDVISDEAARALFIQKIGISDGLKQLRIIRGKMTDEEFGAGLPQEQPVDELDRRVLASGNTESTVVRRGDEASMRTVIPFIATKDFRSNNCLQCHGVREGSVLGAASVVIDIKDDLAAIDKVYTWIWIGQGVLQLVLFVAIAWITRGLLRQLGGEPSSVIEFIHQLAKGNLSQEIAVREGDGSSLLFATRQMQVGLRSIVSGIHRSADSLAQAASQLTSSSRKVLDASEKQSEVSASVASSVEEMTTRIGQIAESASHATEHASETGQLAEQGAGAFKEVIAEMDVISGAVTNSSREITSLGEKSLQISQIVQVIKDIAEQTNLLALNAAIEAARAGEQGRGFAVVSDEIRKLAERTARSTQEIASMIEAIQNGTDDAVKGMQTGNQRVGEGVQLVSRAGSSIDKMQEGVRKVLASVSEISSSLKEQSATSGKIAGNVDGIARMTGESSTIVKEVAVAADHLEQLAQTLKQSVGQFIL